MNTAIMIKLQTGKLKHQGQLAHGTTWKLRKWNPSKATPQTELLKILSSPTRVNASVALAKKDTC